MKRSISNIIKSILLLTLNCLFLNLYASGTSIENVFVDISKDYQYYNQLQSLYNGGVITPDKNGKFDPFKIINRDEFISISMESFCKNCRVPNTDLSLINKYNKSNTFFDLLSNNEHYYCVMQADDENLIKGYGKDFKCDDGTYKTGERSFCPNNKVSLDEAISIMLKNSNIFTELDNEKVMIDIKSGKISEKISDDVSPKNTDGTPNYYYGYLKKALSYSIEEYDSSGNKKTYKMLEIKSGKIYPKKLITKQDLLNLSYIIYKTNSCKDEIKDNLAVKIGVYNKSCNSFNEKCDILKTKEDIIDFKGEVGGQCEKGVNETEGYIWKFYDKLSGKTYTKTGKFIDNYNFLTSGEWNIFLKINDLCGNSGEGNITLFIDKGTLITTLSNFIEIENFYGEGPLKVKLKGNTDSTDTDLKFDWSFGDTTSGFGREIEHIYKEIGTYRINLKITDSKLNESKSSILIKINSISDKSIDSDLDGIDDLKDLCPLDYGNDLNQGCPIFDKSCNSDLSCPKGLKCSVDNSDDYLKGICIPEIKKESCLYDFGLNNIYGNAICSTCPCPNFLDFNSSVRKCDLVFPAITSIDNKNLYGNGSFYQIKK